MSNHFQPFLILKKNISLGTNYMEKKESHEVFSTKYLNLFDLDLGSNWFEDIYSNKKNENRNLIFLMLYMK